MSIVNQAVSTKAATAKRVTYGIELKVGTFVLNEWGLHESQAKEVHEVLVSRNDEPFTVQGITFSRRPVSELSSAIAAFKAAPKEPEQPAPQPEG